LCDRLRAERTFGSTAGSGAELELGQLIECGDEILGLGTFHGRGHGSGIEVEHFIGHLWTVDAGLLVRIQIDGWNTTEPGPPDWLRRAHSSLS
jgi:hypothetical protein